MVLSNHYYYYVPSKQKLITHFTNRLSWDPTLAQFLPWDPTLIYIPRSSSGAGRRCTKAEQTRRRLTGDTEKLASTFGLKHLLAAAEQRINGLSSSIF